MVTAAKPTDHVPDAIEATLADFPFESFARGRGRSPAP
jgi:hypothetical protein